MKRRLPCGSRFSELVPSSVVGTRSGVNVPTYSCKFLLLFCCASLSVPPPVATPSSGHTRCPALLLVQLCACLFCFFAVGGRYLWLAGWVSTFQMVPNDLSSHTQLFGNSAPFSARPARHADGNCILSFPSDPDCMSDSILALRPREDGGLLRYLSGKPTIHTAVALRKMARASVQTPPSSELDIVVGMLRRSGRGEVEVQQYIVSSGARAKLPRTFLASSEPRSESATRTVSKHRLAATAQFGL